MGVEACVGVEACERVQDCVEVEACRAPTVVGVVLLCGRRWEVRLGAVLRVEEEASAQRGHTTAVSADECHCHKTRLHRAITTTQQP